MWHLLVLPVYTEVHDKSVLLACLDGCTVNCCHCTRESMSAPWDTLDQVKGRWCRVRHADLLRTHVMHELISVKETSPLIVHSRWLHFMFNYSQRQLWRELSTNSRESGRNASTLKSRHRGDSEWSLCKWKKVEENWSPIELKVCCCNTTACLQVRRQSVYLRAISRHSYTVETVLMVKWPGKYHVT